MLKKLCVRIKIKVDERIRFFAKQERKTIQDMVEELLELGILEKLKGEIYEQDEEDIQTL